jgi:hypothetical protein
MTQFGEAALAGAALLLLAKFIFLKLTQKGHALIRPVSVIRDSGYCEELRPQTCCQLLRTRLCPLDLDVDHSLFRHEHHGSPA